MFDTYIRAMENDFQDVASTRAPRSATFFLNDDKQGRGRPGVRPSPEAEPESCCHQTHRVKTSQRTYWFQPQDSVYQKMGV